MPATSEVKILGDDGSALRVGGYGVVFGGRDVVGDQFTPSTDLWLDKLSPTPPVLFDHGGDSVLKRAVVGRVTSTQADDVGLWIEAKITANKRYRDAISHLVKEGVLGWSSGAVGHLVERTKSKELTSWAIAEFSLTPTPAEPRTLGVRQLKSLGAFDSTIKSVADSLKQVEGSYEDITEDICEAAGDLLGGYCHVIATFPDYAIVTPNGEDYFRVPYTLDADGDPVLGTPEPVQMSFQPMGASAEKAVLNAAARNRLSGSDFAYTDSNGGQHLPVNDAAHVRAAMSRFNQTHFESPDKKRAAARKIQARARSLGIEISADSAVAQAAKGGPLLEDAQEEEVLRGAAKTLVDLGQTIAGIGRAHEVDSVAMERFGIDTKDCHRFYKGRLAELDEAIKQLTHLREWAQSIDEGEDGIRRVNFYKHQLALIQLEAS